ncbi:MAG: electron transfer flavoprotein subunit alpha/FixB family protein [Spirochaetota bacterium]
MSSGSIWVVAEKIHGRIHSATFELLTRARSLSRVVSRKPAVVLFEEPAGNEKRKLEQYGAQEVVYIKMDDDCRQCFEVMAEVLSRAVLEENPSVILAGSTLFGRTLMPLAAAKLRTGLTADCTALEMDPERQVLLQTRPAFGGNLMATIECPEHRPQMATVRPGTFKEEACPEPTSAGVKLKTYSIPEIRAARVKEIIQEKQSKDITRADIIVSGGRGLGKPEGFRMLEDLGARIGAMVGASRGAVDMGWIDSSAQVGQTGHTVSPRLYIACGISGAIQHVAGMKDAETIVAVNEDPTAPIFEIADYGIVGDVYEIIPWMLKLLNKKGN